MAMHEQVLSVRCPSCVTLVRAHGALAPKRGVCVYVAAVKLMRSTKLHKPSSVGKNPRPPSPVLAHAMPRPVCTLLVRSVNVFSMTGCRKV